MPKPKQVEKLVLDTSVLIDGVVSKRILSNDLAPSVIIIPEAALGELEHQANMNRETGYLGLEEIKRLRDLAGTHGFTIEFGGNRPGSFEVSKARSGAVDNLIREIAYREGATLMTADRVQSIVAEAKGIQTIYVEFEQKPRKLQLEQFFDATTMSVHLREQTPPHAKRGKPGQWEFTKLNPKAMSRDQLKEISKEIVEEAGMREDGFIEIDRRGSTIIQLGTYRIVITKPPFSDGWEITAVKPVTKLSMKDYEVSDKLKNRIIGQAEGILIAGAPGMGKSTFAQALAEYYSSQERIVKTVEAPRDLQVDDSITQYSLSHGSSQEIHDVLLLTRPDHVLFDEMRNTEDFVLYADLRLSGVGMVGIVHATKPIDAIQRFIGKLDLGVIPQIVDTVLFVNKGTIGKAYSVRMEVKVPAGMTEADLARPVVVISDFETGKQEYELYSYGEETVVIPVKEGQGKSPLQALAADSVERHLRRHVPEVKVEFVADSKCVVYVPEYAIAGMIGKGGSNVERLEKELGVSIEIKELEQQHTAKRNPGSAPFEAEITKKDIRLYLSEEMGDVEVEVKVQGQFLLSGRVGKTGMLKIRDSHRGFRTLLQALNQRKQVDVVSINA